MYVVGLYDTARAGSALLDFAIDTTGSAANGSTLN